VRRRGDGDSEQEDREESHGKTDWKEAGVGSQSEGIRLARLSVWVRRESTA
jgi:hypothetical protein